MLHAMRIKTRVIPGSSKYRKDVQCASKSPVNVFHILWKIYFARSQKSIENKMEFVNSTIIRTTLSIFMNLDSFIFFCKAEMRHIAAAVGLLDRVS